MGPPDDDLRRKSARQVRTLPTADTSEILNDLHLSLCNAFDEYDTGVKQEDFSKQRAAAYKALEAFSQATTFFGFSTVLCDPIRRVERALVCIDNGYTDRLFKPVRKSGRPIGDIGEAYKKGIVAGIAELFWLAAQQGSDTPNLDLVMAKAAKEISTSPYLKKISGRSLRKLRERIMGYNSPSNNQKVEQDTYKKIVEIGSNQRKFLEFARTLISGANIPLI